MTLPTLTAPDAFRDLQTKIGSGTRSRGHTLFGSTAGGEDFILNTSVPDQSVAFPDRIVPARARLRVVNLIDGNVLVVQFTIRWKSIYGLHSSVAAWLVTLNGDSITITPKWQQEVPKPTLDNIEIHTGDVTAADYHQRTLNSLRAGGGRAVTQMLFDGNSGRSVDPQEFVALAELIKPWPVEL